jgi:hypothetical protein
LIENFIIEIIIIWNKIIINLIDYYKYIKIFKYFFYINNNLHFIFCEKKKIIKLLFFLFTIYFINLIINNSNFEPELKNKIIIIKIEKDFEKI